MGKTKAYFCSGVRYLLAFAIGLSLKSSISSFHQNSSLVTPLPQEKNSPPASNNANSIMSAQDHSCHAEMLRILQRQDCFRQSRYYEATNHNNTTLGECSSLLPFHTHAAYFGQGFGRIVEHTVDACIFATIVLERPCTIDIDCRDTYWTWRSFLNIGLFNWDWNHVISKEQRSDIAAAIQDLPNPYSSEWTISSSDSSATKNSGSLHQSVLPMVWHKNWTLEQHLDNWRTESKVLLSPSWGDAWFKNVPLTEEIINKTRGKCHLNQLQTLFQNAMYQPTSLSKALHQERWKRISSGKSLVPKEQARYGAIHLRTIQSDVKVRNHYNSPVISQILFQCIEKAIGAANGNSQHETQSLSQWWLISDNRTVAEHMKKSLLLLNNNVNGTNSTTIISNLDVIFDDDSSFWNDYKHSGGAMKQKFFQPRMAPAMMDFMVLHESKVSIVSHGAFGITGARGNGKVKLHDCGPSSSNQFAIYA